MRGLLTGTGGAARPKGQAWALLLLLAGLGFSGCVGGQSGSEGLCGDSSGKRENDGIYMTATGDEDGGTEDDAGDARNEITNDQPEIESAPTQCLSPDED